MSWNIESIRKEVSSDIGQALSSLSRPDLEKLVIELAVAAYPFRVMRGALTNNPRLSRYSHYRATSDLFPFRHDEKPDDYVWLLGNGRDEWLPEEEALQKGLRYQQHSDGIELCEATIGEKFRVLEVSGSEFCASVYGGSLQIEDFTRLCDLVGSITKSSAPADAKDRAEVRG